MTQFIVVAGLFALIVTTQKGADLAYLLCFLAPLWLACAVVAWRQVRFRVKKWRAQ